MTDLTLYHCPGTRSAGALWLLEEIGVEYDLELVDIFAGAGQKPDYLKINPSGKVPSVRHGEIVVSELAAISLYLCDAFPGAGLAPAVGDPKRAEHYFWHVFRPGVLEPAMIAKTQGWIAERGMVGWGDFETALDRVEIGLGGEQPYLLGEDFSACDVLVGGALGWLRRFGVLEETEAMTAYIDRIEDRDAFRRAGEIDAKLKEEA